MSTLPRLQRAVLGKGGSKISLITQEARQVLMNVFKRDLLIKVRVVLAGQTDE